MRRPRRDEKPEEDKSSKKPIDRKVGRKIMGGPKTTEKYIATHTVAEKETLSHIARKYYKNTARPYWMVIYEANKDVIGDDPGIIVPGQELNIPELPEDLK